MPNKTSLLGFLILLILSTSCGPLVPLSYDKNTASVPLGQTIETEDATVSLEYIQSQHDHYIFDLEVINHSSARMNVAPQLISFYASPKLFPPLQGTSDDVHLLSAPNSALMMKRLFANSPASTRKIYRQKVKSKEAGAVFFALLGVGLAIYDAAKDAEDSQQESLTKKDVNKAIGRDLLVSAAFTASDMANESIYQAREDNYYLPYELFPECKIQPGDTVRGKIFIPIETSHRYSRVVIPITETDYVFDFKRRSVKNRSQSRP